MASRSKRGKKQSTATGRTPKLEPSAEATPNWPKIHNTSPAEDLAFDVVLDNQILTIPNLWTASLCRNYVTFLSTLPLSTTPSTARRGEAVRVNDRFQVDDAAFAEQLWSRTGLERMVGGPIIDGKTLSQDERRELWGGKVLGLNSNIRIYRYSKGQFFDQHYDESNNVMFPSASNPDAVRAKTTWTLLLYLTSPTTGCKGGETVFYPDPPNKRTPAPAPVVAELAVGLALLHRHGKDCLLHEGREVTEGEKWVIRSDLCVAR